MILHTAKPWRSAVRFAPDRLVTTDEVLAEYLTFFSRARASIRERVGRTVAGMINSIEVRVIPQNRESFLAGLELHRARPDKGYSLTDCISIQTMRREGLMDVLTGSRYFRYRTLECGLWMNRP